METTPPSRWRRLWPETGAAYELFDAGVFVVLLGLIGYVFTTPPATTRRALTAPLDLLPPNVWGILLATAGVAAIVCAYTPGWLRVGYKLLLYPCLFWSANFAIGVCAYAWRVTFTDAEGQLSDTTRALLSVLLYGWIASRLLRDMPPHDA